MVQDGSEPLVGWDAEEVRLDQPTRSSRLKWAIVVDAALPAGLATNAAVCLAASVGHTVPNLVGPAGKDATGDTHSGLPWAGCTILAAAGDQLALIRGKAATSPGMFCCGMPTIAQTNRVYAEYLDQLAETDNDDLKLHAVSLLGPRNRVDKLVRKLPLLQ